MGVLWLRVEKGLEETKPLAGRINHALQDVGFSLETRPFRAHVTLARRREKIPSSILKNVPKGSPCPEGQVDAVHLYQSTLTPSGPHYTRLNTVSLGR